MARRNRILMLLENSPYRRDVRVRSEAESLTRAGYAVTVICPAENRRFAHDDVGGVQVYAYPEPPGGPGKLGFILEYGYSVLMLFIMSLVVFVRRGFDVIHAHNPPDMLVIIGLYYKLFGKKYVFDHHDLSSELYRHAKFGTDTVDLFYRLLVFFEVQSCRFADRVIATNQSYKRIQIARAHIAPEKIYVVRNGPRLTPLAPPMPDASTPDASTPIVIGYLGIINPQDGVDQLILALHHLVHDQGRRDFRCILAGSGDAIPAVQALSQQLSLDEFITFTGWVDYQQVPRYLQSFDICVAPEPSNPYADLSTVIKIMEYMSFAKPIVSFDLPEHRYSAGDAALYAPNNDPQEFARLIARLMDDPDLRRRMGQIGYARIADELGWEHQEKVLLDLYRGLLPAHSSAMDMSTS
jgi:glycosyltransferase involved in cell wall biosynthesis